MAVRILNIIPPQGFEIVRDRIGEIITEEISNQEILQNLGTQAGVFNERLAPFSDEEILMINIMYDGSNYGSFTEKDAKGPNIYYIDVYSTAKATPTEDGGNSSSRLLHKYLGMCRHILQSHLYNTLGFPPGLIMGTYIEQIQISDPQNNQDAANVTMGRITFSVRIVENQELWEGVPIGNNTTSVKLSLTNKGYKYEIQ